MLRLLALAAFALAARASDAVSLSGVVVNTVTGAPVRYARVWLLPASAETESDGAGAFQFTDLRPGTYAVMAAKTGFTTAKGYERGYAVTLTQSRGRFEVGLAPLSSIRGRIRDEDGDPVENATVLVLQSAVERGHRRTRLVNATITNDTGEYRVAMLPAGEYLIKASGQFSRRSYYSGNQPRMGTSDNFAPLYFAEPVPLAPGAEGRADFLVAMQPGHTIRGRIDNLTPHANADLQLSRGDEDLGITRSALELATGQFEIHGALDGHYRLRAYQSGKDGEWRLAERDVEVHGADVEGVALSLGTPASVKGKVRVEGQHGDAQPEFFLFLEMQDSALALNEEMASPMSGEIENGAFEVESVFPGKYWLDFHAGDGLYVSAARMGDRDLLASPEMVVDAGTPELEVVLRADGGSVSGTVASDAGPAFIVLVPQACNRPAEIANVEGDHSFSIRDVAPGSYRLYAWKWPSAVEYGSPATLCALARGGTPVEVKAGEDSNVQVRKLSEEAK